MIKYSSGTVFNSGCNAMVNTVNCLGIMGAGIALEFKLRYPLMFLEYKEKCRNKQVIIGNVDYWKGNNGDIIINFPTKYDFRYPSRLDWIENGLINFVKTYKKMNLKSVAFPKLGVSHGELSWMEVQKIMERHLSSLEIDVIICLDETRKPEGQELEMVNAFNNILTGKLSSKVRLNRKQLEKLDSCRPISRFRDLQEIESIGTGTYERLFEYFYSEFKPDTYEEFKLDL